MFICIYIYGREEITLVSLAGELYLELSEGERKKFFFSCMLRSNHCMRVAKHSTIFLSRLAEMEKMNDIGLCSEEYKFLRKHLDTYKQLQSVYAVKQSDVERARRAAQQCGLEFTKTSKK